MLAIIQEEQIDLQALKIASRNGFDPESEEAKQALRILIEKIHLDGTALLLGRGMERTKTRRGEYLLHNAVLCGNIPLTSLFFQSREVEPTDEARAAEEKRVHDLLHLEDNEGRFPLAIAAGNDDQAMIDYLLVSGAQAGHENKNGDKAAAYAVFDETMQYLNAQEDLQKEQKELKKQEELQEEPSQSGEPSGLSPENVAPESHSHCCHIL